MLEEGIKKQLRLPEIGQIGYVVADLDRAIAHARDRLGIRPWVVLNERPCPCMERGREIHPLLRIGLAYAGPVQVELIQVAEGESLHLDHLKRPESEVHHLGFMVHDLAKRLDEYKKAGVEVLQRGRIRDSGLTVDYVYLDTVEKAGIILELIQWRLGFIPVPMNGWMYRLLSSVGSMTFLRGRVVP